MKKLLFVLAIAGLMTACNNKKKDDGKKPEGDTTQTTQPTTDNPPADNSNANTDVPTFADADVQAYVNSYEEYIAAYKKAVEGKDMAKMGDLAKMGQDLTAKGTAAAQKLATSPADAKKLSDYMMAKAAEVTELAKKLTGQ